MDHVFKDYRGEDEMARRVRIERAILEGEVGDGRSGEVGDKSRLQNENEGKEGVKV